MTTTTTTPPSPYSRAAVRVTFRAAEEDLAVMGALAAAMRTTTSSVIRAGLARLHADMLKEGPLTCLRETDDPD